MGVCVHMWVLKRRRLNLKFVYHLCNFILRLSHNSVLNKCLSHSNYYQKIKESQFILLFTKQFRTKRVSLLFPSDTDTHTVVCYFVKGKVCIVVMGNVMIEVSVNSLLNH